ncbi:MAG: 3'-5' exonuclease [Caldilineae bacterium]|nr:3'-5' exonuclease [Chloroflexota bacterium]MCB9177737.1 3'-5' exonuclease [Caldilineae bacterium]
MDLRVDPTLVSVDVETAGPEPGAYAMLSLGACLVADPDRAFYVELRPTSDRVLPEALAVSGLSMDALRASGTPPERAMADLEAWLREVTPPPRQPVMVGFNVAFDWMFVNAGFWRCLGRNPFGHAALDLKALYMGVTGCAWQETGLDRVAARYGIASPLTHHAGEDARYQAHLMRHILAERADRKGATT